MNRLRRYWKLWRELPTEERRHRAARVRERWLRRDPRLRRLGLAPNTPRWSSLQRALDVPLHDLAERLRAPDPARGPLFDSLDGRAAGIASAHAEHRERTLRQAGKILNGEIDLLGSGPSRPVRVDGNLDWHLDWKSGVRWPDSIYYSDQTIVRGDGSDVKMPWELSRCQHLTVLGQAHLLADPSTGPARCHARAVCDQIDDWIEHNPRGLGVNWTCSMEVAIRAANWIAAFAMVRQSPEVSDSFILRLVRSLWVHARHVRQNLEITPTSPTTNHYLADLVGLLAVGCALPELSESGEWKRHAWKEIVRESALQVHPDGANYERSLPYHRLVLEMLVHATILARRAELPIPDGLVDRLSRMLDFTAACTRPDGTVPQWGDNDDGRWLPLDGYATHTPHDHRHVLALGGALLERDDLLAISGGRDVESRWLGLGPASSRSVTGADTISAGFRDAGYYVLRSDDLHAAVSCGPVGTAGLGNHSHDDLLSLTVWAGGLEWVADPGTGSYTGDPDLRNLLRGTAAHATLQLGSRAQNRPGTGIDGLFVLGDRAHPEVRSWKPDAALPSISALHRGFSRGSERWTHVRSVAFLPEYRTWTVLDELLREDDPPYEECEEPIFLRWPLHPAASCRIVDALCEWPEPLRRALEGAPARTALAPDRVRVAVRLEHDTCGTFWIAEDLPAGSELGIAPGTHSHRYGSTCATQVVTATLRARAGTKLQTVLFAPTTQR